MTSALLVPVVALLVAAGLVTLAWTGERPRALRWVLTAVAALVVLVPVAVVAIFVLTFGDPENPPDETIVGVRSAGDSLEVWLGPGCAETGDVTFRFDTKASPDDPELVWDVSAAKDLESVRIDEPPSGVQVTTALPDDVDLADQQAVTVEARSTAGVWLEPVVEGTASHPGRYWFGEDHGWLTPSGAEKVLAKDDVRTVCSS